MLLPQKKLSSEQRKLLRLYSDLDPASRESLLAFAEFLVGRGSAGESDFREVHEAAPPKEIPRPEEESVIGAIKRLSESYYMLDRELLFGETSTLMTAHIMHGKEAIEVIDELESLFARYYEDHVSGINDG